MHEEYRRIVPGADHAVLFVHGICGTPDHFRELIPLEERVPEDVSVINMLLDGHGGTVADFASSSGEKWRNQVFSAFEVLDQTHEKVSVVGHSMGTLFALQLADRYPDKLGSLFLLAVPMRPCLKPAMILELLLMAFGKTDDGPPQRIAIRKAAGIWVTAKLWQYIPWIPRFLDLFREIHRTEQIIGRVEADCGCYQSRKDELVMRCSEKILGRNDRLQIIRLEDSSHFYYGPADRQRILRDFDVWINEKTHD